MSFEGRPPKEAVNVFLFRYEGRDIVKGIDVTYSCQGSEDQGYDCQLTTCFQPGKIHFGQGQTQKDAENSAAQSFLADPEVLERRPNLPPPVSIVRKHCQTQHSAVYGDPREVYNEFRNLGCQNSVWDGRF